MVWSPQLFDNRVGLDLCISKLGRVAGIRQTSNKWPTTTVIHLFSKHFLKGYVSGPTPSGSRHKSRAHRAPTQRRQMTHCIQGDSVGAMTEKPERALEAPRGKWFILPASQRRLHGGSATEQGLVTWAGQCWAEKKRGKSAGDDGSVRGVQDACSLGEVVKAGA